MYFKIARSSPFNSPPLSPPPPLPHTLQPPPFPPLSQHPVRRHLAPLGLVYYYLAPFVIIYPIRGRKLACLNYISQSKVDCWQPQLHILIRGRLLATSFRFQSSFLAKTTYFLIVSFMEDYRNVQNASFGYFFVEV